MLVTACFSIVRKWLYKIFEIPEHNGLLHAQPLQNTLDFAHAFPWGAHVSLPNLEIPLISLHWSNL